MTRARCDELADRALPERYLAGLLAEDEASVFEAHYLTCPVCQDALRLGMAVRRSLPLNSRPSGRRRRLLLGAPVGLAAVLGALLILARGPDPGLAVLGDVPQAPIYLGVPVRTDPMPSADSLFAEAMQAYLAGRYPEAAAGLQAALRAGVDVPPAGFFLGASLLMQGDARGAAEAFGRVVTAGDSPYVAEAHYYRAKALLRLGRARDALESLRRVADQTTVIGTLARALADSLSERLRP